MKSMQLPLVAIFFMTYFHRAGGGHDPLGPTPESATEVVDKIAYERVNLPKRNLLCGERWFESGIISFLS